MHVQDRNELIKFSWTLRWIGPAATHRPASYDRAMSSTEFSDEQVNRAIDYVARNGAENRGSLVHYTLVFEAAELPAPQHLYNGGEPDVVSRFMEAFHFRCVERELPPLDSLVVHVAGERGGMPGSGYFRVNRQPDPYGRSVTDAEAVAGARFWENQREECRAWGSTHRQARRR